MLLARIDPGDHEDREALLDRVLDEAVLRLQVQDVIFVDPRGYDEQRPPVDLLGCRRVLDQLHQIGLEDDLAGSEGQIPTDREGVVVGHLDRELALAPGEIVEQIVEAAQEVLAAGLDRRPQHLGIGRDEVGGRHRIDELAGIEVDLLPALVVEAIELVDRVDQPTRGHKIGLLDEVEQRVIVPGRVAEPAIALLRLGNRLRRLAQQAPASSLPEPEVVLPQRDLRLNQPRRVGDQPCAQLKQNRPQIERVGTAMVTVAGTAALGERVHQLLAVAGDFGQDLSERLGFRLQRFLLLGHQAFPYAFSVLAAAPSAEPGWVVTMSVRIRTLQPDLRHRR
jgi:hypothetical protein